MRLIDADALIKHFNDRALSVRPTGFETTVGRWLNGKEYTTIQMAIEWISRVPTIDAIPVEWLDDRANDITRAPLFRRYAQQLLNEWQKEQEDEGCD